ncbi:MAG: DUF882 domain-containing protein, partial [Stellaceae bacterium]
YRSPQTNAMLRERSSGVALHSEHIDGKAIDFYIPGVPLSEIRTAGLQLQRGGVGFYPTSGSPFVHMDTGLIRHWPQIPRETLVKIFPHGRTVHIPADGKPLRNYAQALAEVERQGNAPNGRSLEAARVAGVIGDGQIREAELIAGRPARPQRSLLARLFGSGEDTHEADAAPASRQAPRQARGPLVLASAMSTPKAVATARIVPLPTARPMPVAVATAASSNGGAQAMVTASLAKEPAVKRNIWGDVIKDNPNWPNANNMPSFDVAAAGTASTGSEALAYAAESPEPQPSRVRPMGGRVPRLAREATVIPTAANTTIAIKPPSMTIGGQHNDSPWLRAAMLT